MLVSLDNISLDDGREFDEFISTTSDNYKIDKEILWQDDCGGGGDISGGEHHVLNHPSWKKEISLLEKYNREIKFVAWEISNDSWDGFNESLPL